MGNGDWVTDRLPPTAGRAVPDGSIWIKLTVAGVTVEEGGEAPTKKITFAPAQAVTIPQLPTELPPAALLLLKDHLAVGINLEGVR